MIEIKQPATTGSEGYGLWMITDPTTNGSTEILNETDFTTHANWDVTGDVDDSGGNAAFTFAVGSLNGTLTQTAANRASAGTNSIPYKLTYTVAVSTAPDGDFTLTLSGFSSASTTLAYTAGTHTVYFTSASNASSSDLVITAAETTATQGDFTIDDISLQAVSIKNLEAVRRAQSFDVSADTGDTPIYEIGNEGIVEYKSDIPTVSISITGNQVAKTIDSANSVEGLQWLGLISNNVPSGASREKDFVIGDPVKKHYNDDSGVTYPLEIDDFDELVSSPGNSSSVLQGITTDLLVPIKRGESLNRVFAIGQAYTTALGWTFPVDGYATFDISMESDNFTFYQEDYKTVEIESYNIASAGASASEITVTSNTVIHRVYLNGEELTAAATAGELADTSSRKYLRTDATTLTFTTGILSAGDKVRVWFQPTSLQPAWSGGSGINYRLTADPGDQGAIQRQDVEAYLITDTTVGRIVEGFEVSSIDTGTDTLQIESGIAYLINSTTGGDGDLELYRYDTASGLDTATVTSAAGDVWRVLALKTSNTGAIGATVYDNNAAIPANGVVVATVNALDGVINSFQDAREWNRVGLSLVQNLTMNVDLTRDAVYQLGYEKAVERSLTKPLSVTAGLTAMDADSELMHVLTGNTYDSTNVATAQQEIRLSELSSSIGLQVNLFDSGTSHTDATKKIVLEITNAKANNISLSTAVQGNGEISFSLNSDRLTAMEKA